MPHRGFGPSGSTVPGRGPTEPRGTERAGREARAMGDTYTHGHHESVLRSHTWRTAENSAGYLLAHLRPGSTCSTSAAGRARSRSTSPAGWRPGGARHRRVGRGDRAGAGTPPAPADRRRVRGRRRVRPRPRRRVVRRRARPPGAPAPHRPRAAAAAELRRVLRPGGLLAVRDSDYAGVLLGAGATPLDRWLALYHELTARNGPRPTPAGTCRRGCGRRLRRPRGRRSSTWTFADPESRAWWGGLWADRVVQSSFATQAVEYGLSRRRRAGRHRRRLAGVGRRSPTPCSSSPTSRSSPAVPD